MNLFFILIFSFLFTSLILANEEKQQPNDIQIDKIWEDYGKIGVLHDLE